MPKNPTTLPRSTSGLKPLHALGTFLRPYRRLVGGTALALLCAGGSFLLVPFILRFIIDKGLGAHDLAAMEKGLAALIATVLVLSFSTYARYTRVAWLGEKVVADMRRAVYAHLLTLSPSFFEVTRSGDILSRLSADASILQTIIGSTVSVALRNLVLLTGGIILMLTTSAKLTLMVGLVIPLVMGPILILGRRVRRLSKTNQERQADVNASTEETVYGIRTVQAFGHEAQSLAAYTTQIEDALRTAQAHIHVRGLLVGIVIFLVLSAISVVLGVGGHDLMEGKLTQGQLAAFIGYGIIVASASGSLSEFGGELHRAAGAAERIFELLAIEPTVAAPVSPVSFPPAKGEIAFENVSFHYPARPDRDALDAVSFTARRGERVAIVGPSGAGKTTLFQLALRFYDPQGGRVLLDGVDLKTADPKEARARLALVPQDPVIFSTDAGQNIAYGCPDATSEEIRAAARAAHADDFLSALPHGYDTFLGEKGVRLSGGQKQRLVIARAILRNAPILLLDEATSALDSESERLIQDAMDRLMTNRTTLIIAHRLATVIHADRILVMEAGRVVETGTHSSLIAQNGLYARLASLQFGGAEATPSVTSS